MDDNDKELFFKIWDKQIFELKETYLSQDHADGNINIFDITTEHQRYVLGTFVYNQTTNIPPAFDEKENKPSALKIGNFEGLGYDSSFIYDTKTRILGIESKKPGTSVTSIIKFIETNFNISGFLLKDVVLPEEYKKFLKASDYTRVELDLAIPNNEMGILGTNARNPERIIELMQDLKGANAKIVISNGRSRTKKLSIKSVRDIANWFIKSDIGEDITKNLRITRVDADTNHSHIFDLISNRLITYLAVEKRRTISTFQIKSKYKQLLGDFLRYREQLELLQK
ncbi:hypothetical protein HYN49_10100 [Flavobacterium pallidum]|uniref:Uncharacterized protein n=2 Tax=Flavobacterium pallidum TaxID=2172098 RepID=A0A2S1SIH9_9FLAO|nr:hypothetical protein HYN49_10100 [Flavobacterium pallidum]